MRCTFMKALGSATILLMQYCLARHMFGLGSSEANADTKCQVRMPIDHAQVEGARANKS